MKFFLNKTLWVLTCIFFFSSAAFTADADKSPKPWEKKVPESKEDLLSIQAKLQDILKKAKQAVVAVRTP